MFYPIFLRHTFYNVLAILDACSEIVFLWTSVRERCLAIYAISNFCGSESQQNIKKTCWQNKLFSQAEQTQSHWLNPPLHEFNFREMHVLVVYICRKYIRRLADKLPRKKYWKSRQKTLLLEFCGWQYDQHFVMLALNFKTVFESGNLFIF